MKKIILLALLVISIVPAYSQTSIGIIGGYNHASLRPKDKAEATGIEVNSYTGWRAGIITDHHLFGKFYLQPQFLLNTKGHNIDLTHVRDAYSFDYLGRRLTYIELQTNMLFKQQAGAGKIFAGVGPYIGRGIAGDARYEKDRNGIKAITHYPIKYKSKDPVNSNSAIYLKPYDTGINFLAGYELKNGLFFNAVYSLGLTRIFYGNSSGDSDKNTYFGLSMGYFFKKFS